MRIKPRWWIGVLIVVAYAAWVMGVWIYHGIDYLTIGAEANLVRGVIQPLGIAAVLLAAFNAYAGWWRATLFEVPRVSRPWFLVVLLLAMLGFIGVSMAVTDWAAVGARHLMILAAATLLVGFCEEMLTRGVLLVSLRGSLKSEAWVWFASTGMFGLMHATNAFFGVGPIALVQVVLAFCVGTGLYLLRRLGGSLLLPILVHAVWDFSSIASVLAQAPTPLSKVALLAATYLLSLVFVVLVLRGEGKVARS